MTVVTPLTSRTPGSLRRPRVPPAIIRGSEALPALHVVDEIPGDLGVVLWRSVRNVLLWAHTPPERRGMLFDTGAAAARTAELGRVQPDAELLAPLSVVIALLEVPERVEVRRLVNACRRIAVWAEGRGALGTALEYTQAAALVRPDSAGLAFAVGRLARRRAEYDRAESWYMRAIVQGRQAGDWRSYSLAFSGLGNLYMQRGNYPYARKAHVRSLRAARRHSLRDLQGDAYHALFAIQTETGNLAEADSLAVEAFAAYGPDHPKVPRLAYDVAYQWTASGRFSVAHSLAAALVPHFREATELALVWGLIARTAGGAGFRSSFEDAVRETRALLASERALDSAARVELGIAYGAASAGDWELAIEFAGAAVQSATRRGESKVLLEAEAALDAARRRSAMQALSSANDACAPFAESLVRALSPGSAAVSVGS